MKPDRALREADFAIQPRRDPWRTVWAVVVVTVPMLATIALCAWLLVDP